MTPDHVSPAEQERFDALKIRLARIWEGLNNDDTFPHTSVIVPSQSVNQEELAKIQGAPFYEERLLFALIRLRNPKARLCYVTSQPVHPDVVDYYLQLLVGVPASYAKQRLRLLCLYDASPMPLTEKILRRPRVIDRLRAWIGDTQHAYLTCYNSTALERQLSLELDVPLNGIDPQLLELGTKSGSRKIFAEAGVPTPAGYEDLRSEDQIVRALLALAAARPGIRRAVVKLNQGFSGEGNGLFTFPLKLPQSNAAASESISQRLTQLEWSSSTESYRAFLRKMREMGGVVEEMIEAEEVHSPSAQMRVCPDGRPLLISTHEQVLGGTTGQVYLGCRFPARGAYRGLIQEYAQSIGKVLSRKGVVGRFGIDFLLSRANGSWNAHALEINLRMGGTTPPFHALEFLTSGHLDRKTGTFFAPDGREKYYYATDNLKSASYRGLLPEDLLELVARYGLHFNHASGAGVLFYMFGALSQFGKLGMTSIGNSRQEADEIFHKTVAILDGESHADLETHGRLTPLFDNPMRME